MSVEEVYEKLLKAKRPIDFFEEVLNENELRKKFKNYSKEVHPDIVPNSKKYIATEAFKMLNDLHKLAQEELKKEIYYIVDSFELYKHAVPIFEMDIGGQEYKFYEHAFEGDVANIFKGINDNSIVYLKITKDSQDNELIENEFEVLDKLKHQSMPFIDKKVMINDNLGIIMREVEGVPMNEFIKEYPRGIPAEHVMWMLERLFSVIGYLHSNYVVHGNIKPEHIIINKKNHNVSLVGFSFCIPEANVSNARYKIINQDFTAPEVNKNTKVFPATDIYSIGKIAIELIGGDIKSHGMPITVHPEIRTFIRKISNEKYSQRPNDAWKLWDEVREIRNRVFGTERFLSL